MSLPPESERRLVAERSAATAQPDPGRVAVFAPSPLLTVTIEPGGDRPEVHLHPGGQGFWVGRLAATLGARVVLCAALGGEPGRVLAGLFENEPLALHVADAQTPNGVYVHDRRSGERREIVNAPSRPLNRHAADELYGIAVSAGLDADVVALTGCQPPDVVDAELYHRLARDLRRNHKLVVADLTGPPLHAALDAGIDLLRMSAEELVLEGYAARESTEDIRAAALDLHQRGAQQVVISRATEPALLIEGTHRETGLELVGPVFDAIDPHGTGDSMFAATAAGLARGLSTVDALRLGMAAGALNATRRGLGSGTREEIESLAAHVSVQ